MSSSLELKEVSFMSCYETRRPCLSGVMRSVLGEPGVQGTGPSLGGDQQWGSQSSFCVAAVAACLVIIHSLNMSTTQAFQERSAQTSQSATEKSDPGRTASMHVSFLRWKLFCTYWGNMQWQRRRKTPPKLINTETLCILEKKESPASSCSRFESVCLHYCQYHIVSIYIFYRFILPI